MNITSERLNNVMAQFFGDKETAQKFAAAMREGLKTNCYENDTRNALSDELERWAAWQGLECKSVDEMLLSSNLSYYQRDYLQNFEFRWEGADEHEQEDENALIGLNLELRQIMHKNGFAQSYQAGGCHAWRKDLMQGDKSPYVLISVSVGEDEFSTEFARVEDADNDFIMCMNFYDAEGVPMAEKHGEQYYSYWKFLELFGGEK